jgi:hypothetical protein
MSDSGWNTAAQEPGENPGLQPGGYQNQAGMTPEQLAYQRGRQDAVRQLTTLRMTPFRVVCGIVWAVISVAFGVGAIYNLVQPAIGEFLLGAVISALAGWYDYRIWTLKARRLFLLI